MSKDEPTAKDRAAAGRAAAERMRLLGLSTAELARRSGFSENTIRDMTQGTSRHNKSTWVAISAVLRFEPDYLFNILNGEADRNATAESPMTTHMARLSRGISEVGTLREDVAGIKDIVRRINEKIDLLVGSRCSSGDGVTH